MWFHFHLNSLSGTPQCRYLSLSCNLQNSHHWHQDQKPNHMMQTSLMGPSQLEAYHIWLDESCVTLVLTITEYVLGGRRLKKAYPAWLLGSYCEAWRWNSWCCGVAGQSPRPLVTLRGYVISQTYLSILQDHLHPIVQTILLVTVLGFRPILLQYTLWTALDLNIT